MFFNSAWPIHRLQKKMTSFFAVPFGPFWTRAEVVFAPRPYRKHDRRASPFQRHRFAQAVAFEPLPLIRRFEFDWQLASFAQPIVAV